MGMSSYSSPDVDLSCFLCVGGLSLKPVGVNILQEFDSLHFSFS